MPSVPKNIVKQSAVAVSGSVWLVLWECYWIKKWSLLEADIETGRRKGVFDKFWHEKIPHEQIPQEQMPLRKKSHEEKIPAYWKFYKRLFM